MSNHEFENYLTLVSRLMRLNKSQTATIRDEMRDHLETRVSELTQSGVDNNEAVRQALEEFGDAALLANRFQTVFQLNQRRWMMRFATFSIAGTFLAAVLVMAMWPSSARFGSPSMGIAQEDEVSTSSDEQGSKVQPQAATAEDIDKILQQVCSFEFEEVPFADVMDDLVGRYKINVVLDQTANDDSLTEDELVTFQTRNMKLSNALRLMLLSKNATYIVNDGFLRIISLDSADDPEFFRRKIFDCRNLLDKISQTDDRVGQPIRVQRRGGGGKGGSRGSRGGGGIFSVGSMLTQQGHPTKPQQQQQGLVEALLNGGSATANNNQQIQTQQQPQQENAKQEVIVGTITAEFILDEVLRASIDPDGWDDTNGDGTLMTVSGFMVVNQTQHVLDEMEELIEELDRRISGN